MHNSDKFRFVSLLALELANGDIALPSLPDVVMKIRKMLEDDNSDFDRISNAISIDPVLVSRLFVYANSSYYNRANVKIETLEGAIGRLGIEVVRNTAMSLAMKQLYNSDQHDKAAKHLRAVWARGMKLSSMAFAVSDRAPQLNSETAFLCGLLHEVGKLYILTKAEEFPEFLGDQESLNEVMEEWNPQITKSIVESWGFSDEIAASADPAALDDDQATDAVSYADIVAVAKLLLNGSGAELTGSFDEHISCLKLGMSEEIAATTMEAYRNKLTTMQQSLSA